MKLSVSAIAQIIGGQVQGNPDTIIESAAPIEKALSNQITFFAEPKFADSALASKAGCIIVGDTEKEKFKDHKGSVIFANNPRYAFMLLLREAERHLRPIFPVGVDTQACVSPHATIGSRVHIGPFCTIEAGAEIGNGAVIEAGCYIGHNVKIGPATRLQPGVKVLTSCEIGKNCILYAGAVIGSDGFGYTSPNGVHEKIPQIGKVVIQDKVEIGANTAIDRAALDTTLIGEGTKIDNLVHIAHNVQVGKNCIILALTVIGGSVVIEDNVTISGQCCLADHIRIGKGAILMGKTGIMGNVAPGSILFGHVGRPHSETLRIEAVMSKLPEMYKDLRRMKKILDKQCPEKQ